MTREAIREGEAQRLERASEPRLGADERVGSALVGGAIALVGAKHGGVLGALIAAAGAYGVYRGVSGQCPVSRRIGGETELGAREPSRARASLTIDARPDELYGFWRDLQNRPTSTKHIAAIPTNADIIEDSPGHILAWRTRPTALVQHVGRVRFVPAPDERGTTVHVELERATRPGVIASLIGASATARLRTDLLRLKRLFEVGELGTTRRALRDVPTPIDAASKTPKGPDGHSKRGNGHRSARGRTDN